MGAAHPDEISTVAAERRDEAATARDDAATVRDVAAAGTSDRDRAASDREAAAHDRAEAARDREAWTLLVSASAARDVAAAARDVAAAGASDAWASGDRQFAAADRVAAAKDREDAATDRHGAEEHLQQAYRDSLTGLPLRDAGRDQLAQAVARAGRIGEPLVLAFVDVDHLKAVNDSQGHAGGDAVLRAVGSALRAGVRSYDIVVRYGGDEFLCAFVGAGVPDAEDRLTAVGFALTAALADASFSFGLAELTPDESLDDLVVRADIDMYARRAAQRT